MEFRSKVLLLQMHAHFYSITISTPYSSPNRSEEKLSFLGTYLTLPTVVDENPCPPKIQVSEI